MSHPVATRPSVVVFAWLVVLTALTVGAAHVDLGYPGGVVVALAIAVAKATLVGLWFMHLKYETRIYHAVALFPVVLFCILACAMVPDVVYGSF
ncbi:MAG: cytochrome C oxidase subunit IV family protein [Planctomycetes bacterium]|nr:cytochrome C oxidase subunit IV family protein [Planctomycetota bacterium]